MNDDAAVVQSSSAVTPGRSSPIWWILPSLATAALAYTIVWTASYPGVLMIGAGLVFLLFGAASLLWLVCIGQLAARARLVATIVGFTLVVGSIGSTVAGMPQRVRFAASKAAFEAVVADANAHLPARPPQAVILSTRKIHRLDLDGEPVVDEVPGGTMDFPIRCPRAIGQFKIAECWAAWTKTSHRYTFAGNWNALGDTSGITYAPGARVKDSSDQWHLTGPWYAWTCNC